MKAFFATVQVENTGRAGGYEPVDFYRPGEKKWADDKREEYEKNLKTVEAELSAFKKPMLVKLNDWRRKKDPAVKDATDKDLEEAVNIENDNAASLDKKDEELSAQ